MVSNEVVMETVRKMISSGVDEDTIRKTLQDVKIPDDEIESFLSGAKEEPEPASGPPAEKVPQASPDESIKQDIENASQDQSAQHATTHNILDDQANKLEDVHKNISDLHKKIDSTPTISNDIASKISDLADKMRMIEKELSEIKANTLALQTILKKILETDRKTLIELKKRI